MAHWIVRPRVDVALEAGLDVFPGEIATIGSGEHDIGGIGSHGDVSALTTADVVPVSDVDSAALPTWTAQCRVVLLGAAHSIGKVSRRDDVVELRCRLILLRPRPAAIKRDIGAAVVALDHALRVVESNPKIVIIAVRNLYAPESFPVVG